MKTVEEIMAFRTSLHAMKIAKLGRGEPEGGYVAYRLTQACEALTTLAGAMALQERHRLAIEAIEWRIDEVEGDKPKPVCFREFT